MKLDRRTFGGTLLLGGGAALAGFPGTAEAVGAQRKLRATVVLDAASGRALHRSGACATRFTPCSTFKVPLALMGFDSGVLIDAHHPAWDYDPKRHAAHRDVERARTDPTRWEAESVVWYSQELTRKLGMQRFQAYVDRFGYGNRDLRGTPGKGDGLTRAWLGSSLTISPDEQVAFLRRMLAHRLVSARAHAEAERIIPAFTGSGGWHVRGKTGSGALPDGSLLGWFVGWADKGGKRIVFARFGAGAGMSSAGGRQMRAALLAEIGGLAGV
ncbi:class D beta-lactamase [Sphingomonas sp. HITSZ_GF]|uniref:class D beta-lactamase n=1 Tax=Sphingomonas sp. HITSZ_GF TaxID=3037247 RepID=UPI00240E58EF|nr:class D beta-lactamase [Sphingomonas sp. HITSZ_GF]MDG2535324.1 class D beta-lactamase [Sphingomonas sp. HITSZ_GF]